MKRLMLLIMVIFLVVGCAGNKRCVEWKMTHKLQLCSPEYRPNSWCTVTRYECVKWVDKGITKDKDKW